MAKIYTLGSNLNKLKYDRTIDDQFIHDIVICHCLKDATTGDKVVINLDETEQIQSGLGLRIAMHIRLSLMDIKERAFLPIVLISVMPLQIWLKYGELSHILLSTEGFAYCTPEERDLNLGVVNGLTSDNYHKAFLNNVQVYPDSTIGRHSIANIWGASVLGRIVIGQMNLDIPEVKERTKKLYFKYIFCKTVELKMFLCTDSGENNSIRKHIPEAEGKKILLIDDEASKGWSVVLRNLFSNAKCFDVIEENVSDYDGFSARSNFKIANGDYDLIFLDLRMNGIDEEEVFNPEDFSGMKILRHIKELNKGTQVIMFTASNKAWNMKALLDAGADGYYIKESPEYQFPENVSYANYESLSIGITRCLNRGFLRGLYRRISDIKANVGFEENVANEITNKLDASYFLISNAVEKKQFAYAYISLFEIVETITRSFIEPYNRFLYFKSDNSEVYNWQDKTVRIDHDGDTAQVGRFSIAQQVWAVYKQKLNTLDVNFAQQLALLNDKRNTFIHNLPMIDRRFQHQDIYTPKAFVSLFDAIERIVKDFADLQ